MPKVKVNLPDTDVSLPTLIRAGLAAARNAVRLKDDAVLMLEHERWPTAHLLGVLSIEEHGKWWMCIGMAGDWQDMTAGQRKAFLRGPFRSHQEKLLTSIIRHKVISTDHNRWVDSIQAETALVELVKMLGLYVDIIGDQVQEPSQVTEPMARSVVADATALLDALPSHVVQAESADSYATSFPAERVDFAGMSPEELIAFMRRRRTTGTPRTS
jgi:AbiV family abortive infection protein